MGGTRTRCGKADQIRRGFLTNLWGITWENWVAFWRQFISRNLVFFSFPIEYVTVIVPKELKYQSRACRAEIDILLLENNDWCILCFIFTPFCWGVNYFCNWDPSTWHVVHDFFCWINVLLFTFLPPKGVLAIIKILQDIVTKEQKMHRIRTSS